MKCKLIFVNLFFLTHSWILDTFNDDLIRSDDLNNFTRFVLSQDWTVDTDILNKKVLQQWASNSCHYSHELSLIKIDITGVTVIIWTFVQVIIYLY